MFARIVARTQAQQGLKFNSFVTALPIILRNSDAFNPVYCPKLYFAMLHSFKSQSEYALMKPLAELIN
jgi:hypothetical protein